MWIAFEFWDFFLLVLKEWMPKKKDIVCFPQGGSFFHCVVNLLGNVVWNYKPRSMIKGMMKDVRISGATILAKESIWVGIVLDGLSMLFDRREYPTNLDLWMHVQIVDLGFVGLF